jgi:hypothetical protein
MTISRFHVGPTNRFVQPEKWRIRKMAMQHGSFKSGYLNNENYYATAAVLGFTNGPLIV